MDQITVEVGGNAGSPNSLNNSLVRNLAGVASGAISFANLRGKAAAPPPPPPSAVTVNLTNHSMAASATGIGGIATCQLTLGADGILSCYSGPDQSGDIGAFPAEWAGGTISNPGAYEYLWVLNSGTAPTGAGPQNTWNSLGSGVTFTLNRGSTGTSSCNFTLYVHYTATLQQASCTVAMSSTWTKLA